MTIQNVIYYANRYLCGRNYFEMNGKAVKGFVLAITAAMLWGVSGTFGQFLFQHRGISVEWLITVRMLVAGFCLLCFARLGGKAALFTVWRDKKDTVQLLIFSITGMLAVQYTYFVAIKHSNAATATVLQYSGPILIAIYLALRHRRLPNGAELLAIVLAVAGTCLLVTHGHIHNLSISGVALIAGLASAVALAIYTLQPVALLSRHNAAVVIGWSMFCGGLAFSFVHAPWNVQGYWDTFTWLYTAFIVLFGTLVAFYFYMSAVTLIGGQKSSLLASAEPLSATLLGVIWLNTQFQTIDWVGSICIVSTVFLLSASSKKQQALA